LIRLALSRLTPTVSYGISIVFTPPINAITVKNKHGKYGLASYIWTISEGVIIPVTREQAAFTDSPVDRICVSYDSLVYGYIAMKMTLPAKTAKDMSMVNEIRSGRNAATKVVIALAKKQR
jgi:hypothetical protein